MFYISSIDYFSAGKYQILSLKQETADILSGKTISHLIKRHIIWALNNNFVKSRTILAMNEKYLLKQY
jgi:hypothetical protein